MEVIFMNSEKRKASDFQKLLLNLMDKTSLKRSYKYLL